MLHHKLIAGEIPGTYLVTELINEEDLLTIANQIARQKLAKGEAITDKHLAQQALQTLLQSREHEVFAMLFLDNQHRLLAYEELFRVTLSSASVYPREVVKRALALNAAALMLVRIPVNLNSDSGICEHHFRKVCGQGFFEQKLSFEGRHLFDSPNKPAAKRSAAVVDPGHWSMTVHLTSEFVL